jgi:hypothetical protein
MKDLVVLLECLDHCCGDGTLYCTTTLTRTGTTNNDGSRTCQDHPHPHLSRVQFIELLQQLRLLFHEKANQIVAVTTSRVGTETHGDLNTLPNENHTQRSASNALRQQQQQQQQEEQQQEDEVLRLLKMEELMLQIRCCMKQMQESSIPQERRRIAMSQQRLRCTPVRCHSITNSSSISSTVTNEAVQQQRQCRIGVHGILSEYQLQLQLEEHILIHVLHPILESVYDDAETYNNISNRTNNTTDVQLQQCIDSIRRNGSILTKLQELRMTIMRQIQQQEQQQQQQQQQQRNEEEKTTVHHTAISSSSSIQNVYATATDQNRNEIPNDDTKKCDSHAMHIGNRTKAEDSIVIHPNDHLTSAATTLITTSTRTTSQSTKVVWDLFHQFVDCTTTEVWKRPIINSNHMTTILVVGPSSVSGSGKTYLCNVLEEDFIRLRQQQSLSSSMSSYIGNNQHKYARH